MRLSVPARIAVSLQPFNALNEA